MKMPRAAEIEFPVSRVKADAIEKLIEQLSQLLNDTSLPSSTTHAFAVRLYRQRRLRDRYFSPRLFGEPAWDLLLDLYAARYEGRDISITSACIAAAVPYSTAFKWIERLERIGLVTRHRRSGDDRQRFVTLSNEAHSSLTALFDRIIKV